MIASSVSISTDFVIFVCVISYNYIRLELSCEAKGHIYIKYIHILLNIVHWLLLFQPIMQMVTTCTNVIYIHTETIDLYVKWSDIKFSLTR